MENKMFWLVEPGEGWLYLGRRKTGMVLNGAGLELDKTSKYYFQTLMGDTKLRLLGVGLEELCLLHFV